VFLVFVRVLWLGLIFVIGDGSGLWFTGVIGEVSGLELVVVFGVTKKLVGFLSEWVASSLISLGELRFSSIMWFV